MRLEDPFEAIAAEKFGTKAIEVEAIAGRVEGGEKRDALDVVPVIVADEDVGLESGRGRRLRPAAAEHTNAGATVEDEASAVGSKQLKTRRIAAIAPSGTVYGGS